MTIEQGVKKKNLTLTDMVRARFKGFLDPLALLLNRLGIAPNTITLLGLLGNAVGAVLLARGSLCGEVSLFC